MLHRSFKSSKCKTASKLAMSRIKLLKNKNEEQLKQMKRDLAQLLESGKIQTARIRVEHVIREEKMMAAYDLIGIYCELISTRMTIIESQKNCPIDVKEAITSVIFAARRCADIPELNDIQKHFKTKYGKEFSTAAVELRPECGVSCLLVEKLSAVAPDGQTKVRVLGAIAKEHNIKWDPETFGEEESKLPNDLLSRPNSFEKGSKMHAEPSYFQPSPSHDQMHTEPLSFSNQNPKSSLHIQNLPSSGSTTARFTTFDPEVRPSGMQAKVGLSCPMQGNVFPSGTQDWNLEFKDATSAAQAAAESAELASMAARAAAELSRQYSLESQKSNIEVSRDEGPNYAASSFAEESLSKYSANNSFLRRHSKFQAGLIDGSKHENLDGFAQTFHQSVHCRTGRFNQSASLKLNRSLIEEDSSSQGETHIQKSWPEKETTKKVGKSSSYQMSEGKQSPEFDVTYDGEMNYSTEERYKMQPSTIPFDSYSSTKYMENKGISGDDYKVSNFNHLRYGNVTGKNPSVEQSTCQNDTIRGSSKNDGAVFDESSSDDDDDNRFVIRPSMQNPVYFSQDSFMHVNFDCSDSTDSENASEMKRFLIRKKDSRTLEQIASSYEESCPLKECSINRQRTELEVHSPMKNDLGKSPLHEPDGSSGTFDEFQRQSSSRSGKELNFRLTGGLRNKGSSPKNLSRGNSNMIMRSPPHSASVKDPVSFQANLNRNNKVSSRALLSQSDSDVDNSEEEVLQGTSSKREEPCAQKAKKGVNIKSNLRYPTVLNSSGDDSDEDLPKQFFHNSSMGSGISQSTDTRSSNSEASSYSKLRRGTKGLINSDTREMKSNRSYCDTRTPTMLQSRSAISDSRRNYEHSKFAPSNSMPSYKTSVREVSSIAQSSSPSQKTVRLRSSKDEKTSASTGESPSTENFVRKASHVHPKLPDYDTLAAHMQSLRSKS